MDKFISKTQELQKRVDSIIDAPHIDHYDSLKQFPDLLLDVQLLLFSDSPQNPLYIEAMRLNERKDTVLNRIGDSFGKKDFEKLKTLLAKFFEYRSFLQAED